MPVVQNTVVDPTGTPLESVRVEVRLVTSTTNRHTPAFTSEEEVLARWDGVTDENGAWSVDLVANSDIAPSGTVYEVTELHKPTRLRARYHIEVPAAAGPHDVVDIVVDLPGSLASAALDAHEAATTSVHGIADTADLETIGGAQAKADTVAAALTAHDTDTTNVHGIVDTADLVLRSRNPINVKDYGAVGDGVTDDTAAIQAALDAASTQGGGTVFMPVGTYQVSNLVQVPDKVNLWGDSKRSTLIRLTAANAKVAFGRPSDAGTAPTGWRGGLSGNFRVNGQSLATNALYVGLWVQAELLSVHVENAAGVGILIEQAQNCTFIGVDSVNSAINLQLDYATGGNAFYRCEFNKPSTRNIWITSSGPTTGPGYRTLGPSNNYFHGCLIERVESATAEQVYIGAGQHNVFRDCVMVTSVAADEEENISSTALIRVAHDAVATGAGTARPSKNIVDGCRIQGAFKNGVRQGYAVETDVNEVGVSVRNCFIGVVNTVYRVANGARIAISNNSFHGYDNYYVNTTGGGTDTEIEALLTDSLNGVPARRTTLLARKTSDQGVTNSAVGVAATELVLPVESTATYVLDAVVFYDASTAGDIKYLFAAPTGASLLWSSVGLRANAPDVFGEVKTTGVDIAFAETAGGPGAGKVAAINMRGVLVVASESGTIQFRFSQNNPDATPTIVKAGSFMRLQRVA